LHSFGSHTSTSDGNSRLTCKHPPFNDTIQQLAILYQDCFPVEAEMVPANQVLLSIYRKRATTSGCAALRWQQIFSA
jgi:hypothetical protein